MQRKRYNHEFKTEAVKLAERGEVSIAQVARDLGVPYEVLRRWVKQFGPQPDGKAAITPDERAELIRLRRENRIITEERDIFKKRSVSSRRNCRKIPVHRGSPRAVPRGGDVPGAAGVAEWILSVAQRTRGGAWA